MHPDKPEADTVQPTINTAIPSSPEPGQWTFPPGAIPADFLFKGNQEILISHNGEHYRLRITRNGKLILTK